MKTLTRCLVLTTVVSFAGGAAAPTPAPDVIFLNTRLLKQQMWVDPGSFTKTHFVFAMQGLKLIEITKQTELFVGRASTRVYAVPLSKKAEAVAAARAAAKRPIPPGRRKPHWQPKPKVLTQYPASEELIKATWVRDNEPVYRKETRYTLTAVNKDDLTLNAQTRSFNAKGKELSEKERKRVVIGYNAVLGFVGMLGILGVVFTANRRRDARD